MKCNSWKADLCLLCDLPASRSKVLDGHLFRWAGHHGDDAPMSMGKKGKQMTYVERIAVTKALQQQLKDKFIFTKMIMEEELATINREVQTVIESVWDLKKITKLARWFLELSCWKLCQKTAGWGNLTSLDCFTYKLISSDLFVFLCNALSSNRNKTEQMVLPRTTTCLKMTKVQYDL